jgi:hypothetical protein
MRRLGLVLLIFLLTFGLRMVHLQGRALWYDEAFAVLYASLADGSTDRLIARLARVDLLIIDDLRHVPARPEYATLLFDLIEARHLKRPTMVSSNLSVQEWGHVLGNPALIASLVDRLMEQMRNARTTRDLGMVEVALSAAFVKYASDVQTGLVVPSRIDKGIAREIAYRDHDRNQPSEQRVLDERGSGLARQRTQPPNGGMPVQYLP